MRVLLIEDDLVIARNVSLLLKADKLVVDHAETGEEALGLMRHHDYGFVLLDLILPDMEGYRVLRRMRTARNATPVLVLSGLSGPEAKVKALGLGADDFMTKPFDGRELMARAKAIIRRSRGFSGPVLRVANLALNQDNRYATVSGIPISLTDKEYSILELLLLRKGMVLTKEILLSHLYGGMDEPGSKVIDVFICKIRKKLVKAGAANLISTVFGHGYILREPTGATARTDEQPTPSVLSAV